MAGKMPPWLMNKSGGTVNNNTPVGSAGQPQNPGAGATSPRAAAIQRRMKKNQTTGKK